jgi:starch phosphorylase
MTSRTVADSDAADDGSRDLARSIDRLARRLPEPLQPLAGFAYNYLWSWTPGGRELFRELGAHRFGLSSENPVRFLRDLSEPELLEAATDTRFLELVDRMAAAHAAYFARPDLTGVGPDPIAFLCAEFGVHRSLPVYSGGLGVLAGDMLKEASDQALPFVGVGLLYRRGYFHQRMDRSGWQQEYWIESDPNTMPAVRVTTRDGVPLTITVPIWEGELNAHVWRVQVGRVPLYLLDTEIGENAPLQRWVTARLYEGNRSIRLAQYALLGVGAVRALTAMGIAPALYHLNEGHAAFATLGVASAQLADSPHAANCAQAIEATRDRFVFTTHTPVPAGNESYSNDEVLPVLGRLFAELNFDPHEVVAQGRIHPSDAGEHMGLTPFAIRASRSTNGVSERHGAIARAMWHDMFPMVGTDSVPISHVTNAVHLPTWMSPPMHELLTECFGERWERHAADPAMWKQVDDIDDARLWDVRCIQRDNLVYQVRRKVTVDRLARGEDIDFVQAGRDAFDPDFLTLGFARRLATYKRLNLLIHDAERAISLLDHDTPIQLVFAGKAHPQDDAGKAFAQRMFDLKRVPEVGNKVVFLEDYDLSSATTAVAGCDVWLNLPRPPYEASGTSGMKAAMNGCLNLSVLDGWWMEAYDGTNGWAIDGSVDPDEVAKDERDAASLYDLLEHQVKPLFYERDGRGVPVRWLEMVRASLKTLGPTYCASRMLGDYVAKVYRPTA